MTSHPVWWRVVGHVHDFLNGASLYIWIYQVSLNSVLLARFILETDDPSRQNIRLVVDNSSVYKYGQTDGLHAFGPDELSM